MRRILYIPSWAARCDCIPQVDEYGLLLFRFEFVKANVQVLLCATIVLTCFDYFEF